MSVQAITWVLDKSTSKGNDRCVLIALANRFDPREPERCWPGIETLASEANVSTRTVTRCLDSLQKLGELLVYPKLGGSEGLRSDRRPNLYVIPALSEWRPAHDPTTCHPVDEARPDKARADDPTDATSRPDKARGHDTTTVSSDTTTDPTVTHTTDQGSSNAVARLDEWADDLPAVAKNSGLLVEAKALCEELETTLTERGYRNVIGKSRSKRWLLDMEALLRVDARPAAQVRWAIRWLHVGEDRVSRFWRTNVRSPDKLRVQWDVMREQYRALEASRNRRADDAAQHARAQGREPEQARADSDELVRRMFGSGEHEPTGDSALMSDDVIDVESRGA